MKRLLLALFVFMIPGTWAVAQCCNGVCQVNTYEWRTHQSDPTRQYLYKDGLLIGGYDTKEGYYRPYDAGSNVWGETCQPPISQPPCFGVDTSKLAKEPRYTVTDHSGKVEVSKETAHAIIGDARLEDDSGKLRVTVIGTKDQRDQAVNDLSKTDTSKWAVIRDYDPTHWSVSEGFVTTGSPTIYAQAPTGKVLHRQDDYQGGSEALSEALRKAKANYDKMKDPDLRKDAVVPALDATKAVGYGIAAAAGVAGTVLLKRRRKRQSPLAA